MSGVWIYAMSHKVRLIRMKVSTSGKMTDVNALALEMSVKRKDAKPTSNSMHSIRNILGAHSCNQPIRALSPARGFVSQFQDVVGLI